MHEKKENRQIIKPAVVNRITALMLLIIMINNLTGFYLAFYSQQAIIKKEVKSLLKSSLDDSELVVLHFDKNSGEYRKLQWLDEHEFRYHGRMYDIIRQDTDRRGNVTYHCINDIREEQLFVNLTEQIRNHIEQNPEKQQIPKILLKILTLEFYRVDRNEYLIPDNRYIYHYSYIDRSFITYIDIPSPPPRFS